MLSSLSGSLPDGQASREVYEYVHEDQSSQSVGSSASWYKWDHASGVLQEQKGTATTQHSFPSGALTPMPAFLGHLNQQPTEMYQVIEPTHSFSPSGAVNMAYFPPATLHTDPDGRYGCLEPTVIGTLFGQSSTNPFQ